MGRRRLYHTDEERKAARQGYWRKWYRSSPVAKERSRQYYHENRERILSAKRTDESRAKARERYRKQNPVKQREVADPDIVRQKRHEYYLKRKAAGYYERFKSDPAPLPRKILTEMIPQKSSRNLPLKTARKILTEAVPVRRRRSPNNNLRGMTSEQLTAYRREYARKYRAANPDKVRAAQAKHREKLMKGHAPVRRDDLEVFEMWFSNFGKPAKLAECSGQTFDQAVQRLSSRRPELGIVIDEDGAFYLGNKLEPWPVFIA